MGGGPKRLAWCSRWLAVFVALSLPGTTIFPSACQMAARFDSGPRTLSCHRDEASTTDRNGKSCCCSGLRRPNGGRCCCAATGVMGSYVVDPVVPSGRGELTVAVLLFGWPRSVNRRSPLIALSPDSPPPRSFS